MGSADRCNYCNHPTDAHTYNDRQPEHPDRPLCGDCFYCEHIERERILKLAGHLEEAAGELADASRRWTVDETDTLELPADLEEYVHALFDAADKLNRRAGNRQLTADEVAALGRDPGLRDGGPDGTGRPWTLADV